MTSILDRIGGASGGNQAAGRDLWDRYLCGKWGGHGGIGNTAKSG